MQCDVGNEFVVSVYCSNLFSFADHRGEQHEQSEVEILVSTDFVFQLPFYKQYEFLEYTCYVFFFFFFLVCIESDFLITVIKYTVFWCEWGVCVGVLTKLISRFAHVI